MSTKTNRWIFALTMAMLVVLFSMLSMPVQASAAQATDSSDNTCLTCHEDLYYLHDSGKLYCLTAHTDHCSGCHEGNSTVMKKEESHLGLLLHPQQDNGAKCLECHEQQEIQVRMTNFETNGGFDTAIKADVYYMPANEAATGFSDVPKANPIIGNWKWLSSAFVLFGLWLILVLFSPLKP
jgi:hypothetical protein